VYYKSYSSISLCSAKQIFQETIYLIFYVLSKQISFLVSINEAITISENEAKALEEKSNCSNSVIVIV